MTDEPIQWTVRLAVYGLGRHVECHECGPTVGSPGVEGADPARTVWGGVVFSVSALTTRGDVCDLLACLRMVDGAQCRA